jgi:hypothetical protein
MLIYPLWLTLWMVEFWFQWGFGRNSGSDIPSIPVQRPLPQCGQVFWMGMVGAATQVPHLFHSENRHPPPHFPTSCGSLASTQLPFWLHLTTMEPIFPLSAIHIKVSLVQWSKPAWQQIIPPSANRSRPSWKQLISHLEIKSIPMCQAVQSLLGNYVKTYFLLDKKISTYLPSKSLPARTCLPVMNFLPRAWPAWQAVQYL